jgi:hypothetical protein
MGLAVHRRVSARFPGIAFLILLALSGTVGRAAGLYSAQVPVPSQSDTDRAEALKNALAQVVIRVSGDAGALAKPDVAKAVAGAERYVQQFQYQQDVVNDSAGQPQVRLMLVAQFDRDAVDQLMRDFGLLKDVAAAPTEARAAPIETASGTYHLWIGGVRSALDYSRMIGALSQNELVRDVQVEQARGDGAQLRVTAAASLARLLDSLNTGPVMRVANAKPPVDGIDALLDLRP